MGCPLLLNRAHLLDKRCMENGTNLTPIEKVKVIFLKINLFIFYDPKICLKGFPDKNINLNCIWDLIMGLVI